MGGLPIGSLPVWRAAAGDLSGRQHSFQAATSFSSIRYSLATGIGRQLAKALWPIEATVKTLSISSSISPSHRACVVCPDGGLGLPLLIAEASPCLQIPSGYRIVSNLCSSAITPSKLQP